MGVLKDGPYWADVLNRLSALSPPIGQGISAENAALIRRTACEAFTKLLQDPDFENDLAEAITAAEEASPVLNAVKLSDYHHFVDLFMEIEAKLLRDAGVNVKALGELDRELRKALHEPEADRLEALANKIRYCRNLACDPDMPEGEAKTPLWKAVARGVGGVATIAVDAGATGGAAVLLGPAGAAAVGTVVGISAGAGASMIGRAIKGRW